MVSYSMSEFLFFLSYNRLKEKKLILDIQKRSKILSHIYICITFHAELKTVAASSLHRGQLYLESRQPDSWSRQEKDSDITRQGGEREAQ